MGSMKCSLMMIRGDSMHDLVLKVKDAGKKLASSTAGKLVLLVVAIVYTAIPVDLIPDVIPIVGYLDDLGLDATAICLIVSSFLNKKAQNYVDTTVEEGKQSGDKKVLVTAAVTKGILSAKASSESNKNACSVANTEKKVSNKEMDIF